MAVKEINLLPPSRRQQLRNETVLVSLQIFLRTVNSGLMVLSVVAVAAAVLLTVVLPVVDRGGRGELEATLEDYQQLRDVIVAENVLYDRVVKIGENRVVWTALFREILPTLPSGVRISLLSGRSTLDDSGELETGNMKLLGRAATRTTLVLWESRLSELESVLEVESPTSNLIDRVDLDYDLTLVLTDDGE